MELHEIILNHGMRAKEAARALRTISTDRKNAALLEMAEALVSRTPEILEAKNQNALR